MVEFLSKTETQDKFELLIDTNIFPKDIILKASYNYLDKWYFFFKFDENKNIILQFTLKDNISDTTSYVIWEFSDTLLETYLRDKLEKDNKIIREVIVEKAINGPLDQQNFVESIDENQKSNEQNFDNDINDILADIANDPELEINSEEIEWLLKEVEAEEESKIVKPNIPLNIDALSDVKKQFKK